MTALSTYLQGEGTLLRNPPRCEDCQASCNGCLKASRLNPTAETTLQKMESNLREDKLPNNAVQFTCNYVFSKDPELAFPVVKSNYESALRQSRTNYKKNAIFPRR